MRGLSAARKFQVYHFIAISLGTLRNEVLMLVLPILSFFLGFLCKSLVGSLSLHLYSGEGVEDFQYSRYFYLVRKEPIPVTLGVA